MSCDTVAIVGRLVTSCLHAQARRPLVIGICGAQGSGKTTLVQNLPKRLAAAGMKVYGLSLDAFYLTRGARAQLARSVHPLLAVRGVPGTHDVALCLKTLDALCRAAPTMIPKFRKEMDDQAPQKEWDRVTAPVDIVLFEGWCVGAHAQTVDMLVTPVNDLERRSDPDGCWRAFVNHELSGCYQHIFTNIDALVLLRAPDFDVIANWRAEQESRLRLDLVRRNLTTQWLMDDTAIRTFISHFERLTRHIMVEMPGRADLVIQLDADRCPVDAKRL